MEEQKLKFLKIQQFFNNIFFTKHKTQEILEFSRMVFQSHHCQHSVEHHFDISNHMLDEKHVLILKKIIYNKKKRKMSAVFFYRYMQKDSGKKYTR